MAEPWGTKEENHTHVPGRSQPSRALSYPELCHDLRLKPVNHSQRTSVNSRAWSQEFPKVAQSPSESCSHELKIFSNVPCFGSCIKAFLKYIGSNQCSGMDIRKVSDKTNASPTD